MTARTPPESVSLTDRIEQRRSGVASRQSRGFRWLRLPVRRRERDQPRDQTVAGTAHNLLAKHRET